MATPSTCARAALFVYANWLYHRSIVGYTIAPKMICGWYVALCGGYVAVTNIHWALSLIIHVLGTMDLPLGGFGGCMVDGR